MSAACPICHKPALPRAENSSFPFCSGRCRQVDLGRWLGEEYRMASESEESAHKAAEALGTRTQPPELDQDGLPPGHPGHPRHDGE
jgi:uncharacterized protein